jgi:hypothetical protein
MTRVETFTATPVGVLTLIDLFAELRGTRGLMPGPVPPVRFTLISRREVAGLTLLDPPIMLAPDTGASGAYLFSNESRLGGSAAYRIAPGRYVVRIESDYYQTLDIEVSWPPSPGDTAPIALKPGVAYPFPDLTLSSTGLTLLRGALLLTVTGAPIAGAFVELIDPPNMGPFANAVTDATGGWVLALPVAAAPPVLSILRFTLPGEGGVVTVPNVALEFGQENSLSQTALRGAVLSTTGIPVANAEINVSTQAGSVRSGRDGRWTFYLSLLQPDGAARVTATASNGRSAFQDVQIRNRATVVVPVIQIAMN